jgi:hypothetical protein
MGDFTLALGASFERESDLFIASPPEAWEAAYGDDAALAFGGYAASYYYRWDGERLIQIDSLLIGSAFQR